MSSLSEDFSVIVLFCMDGLLELVDVTMSNPSGGRHHPPTDMISSSLKRFHPNMKTMPVIREDNASFGLSADVSWSVGQLVSYFSVPLVDVGKCFKEYIYL